MEIFLGLVMVVAGLAGISLANHKSYRTFLGRPIAPGSFLDQLAKTYPSLGGEIGPDIHPYQLKIWKWMVRGLSILMILGGIVFILDL